MTTDNKALEELARRFAEEIASGVFNYDTSMDSVKMGELMDVRVLLLRFAAEYRKMMGEELKGVREALEEANEV